MTRRVSLLLSAALLLAAGECAAAVKTLAIQGDPSPLVLLFTRFANPVVGDVAGERVAVYGRTRGPRRCVFTFDPDGAAGVLACERLPAPGDRIFGRFGAPAINAGGRVVWPSGLSFGLHGVVRDGTDFVALLGDPTPGSDGLLQQFSATRITTGGDVVFKATISGGALVDGVPISAGIFRCTGGDGRCTDGGTGMAQPLLFVTDPVPDRPGRFFCGLGALAASDYGVVFTAQTRASCADELELPLSGVFRLPFGGAAETLALQGESSDPLPGPGGTIHRETVSAPAIADDGRVAFTAKVTGILSTTALFVCPAGSCPASPPESTLTLGQLDGAGAVLTAFSGPAISNAGDVAFRARLAGPARGAVFIRRASGTLESLVRVGDPVPGIGAAVFRGLFGDPAMSAGGRVAFRARIRRDVRPRLRFGLFVVE